MATEDISCWDRSQQLKWRKYFSILESMGKVHTGNGWLIRVQGNEHPPVHVHVLHPDGKAVIDLDGSVTNDRVPVKVLKQAVAWVLEHEEAIADEWSRMNNPTKR